MIERTLIDPLTFGELRLANVKRCAQDFRGCETWTANDWACAVAGEVGETCNLLKKVKRGEDIRLSAIAGEIADAVTYLDLLADHLGINLGAAVRRKFNVVSERIGSEVRL